MASILEILDCDGNSERGSIRWEGKTNSLSARILAISESSASREASISGIGSIAGAKEILESEAVKLQCCKPTMLARQQQRSAYAQATSAAACDVDSDRQGRGQRMCHCAVPTYVFVYESMLISCGS